MFWYLYKTKKKTDIILLYRKYASIHNGAAYCLKYYNTKSQLHSVECGDHGFTHKGRGLQCKSFHDLQGGDNQDNSDNQKAFKSVPKCY